jgi:hypothetical protein
MTDDRTDDTIPQDEPLDDEFHSTLEIDDSSGWRVFIVPGLLLLFVLGAILFIVLNQSDTAPDPRVAEHLRQKQAEEAKAQSAPLNRPSAPTPMNQATAVPAPASEKNEQ